MGAKPTPAILQKLPREDQWYCTRQDLPEILPDLLERARLAPFYGTLFEGKSTKALASNWHEIPFTLKKNLVEHSPDGFRALPLEKIFHYHESFGTVDKPLSSWYTVDDFDYLPAIAGKWAGAFAPGKKILNRFPYSFPVPAILVESIARVKGGVVIPTGNLTWNVPYSRTLELIGKLKPQILCGLPLEPVLLWELAKLLKIPSSELCSFTDICLSGGTLTPSRIRAMEEIWGAKIHNIYGSTEGSGLASSCVQGHLHLHSDDFLFEVVSAHPPHDPVAVGETGILVITTLHRQAMPLIRYFTRDFVRVDSQPCSCGAKEQTLTLLGRIDDTLHHSGKTLYAYDLDETVLSFALKYSSLIYFVVVVSQGLIVRIEVEKIPDHIPKEDLSVLEKKLGVPVKIEFVPRDALLHRGFMLKDPKVYKPQFYSDWRHAGRKVSSISEALIEWPRYSLKELFGLMKRSVKRVGTRRRYSRFTF